MNLKSMTEDQVKALLRPKLAMRLVNFSLAYITAVEMVIPVINALIQYKTDIPGDAVLISVSINEWVLGLLLTYPVSYIFGRTIEKVKNGQAEKGIIGQ